MFRFFLHSDENHTLARLSHSRFLNDSTFLTCVGMFFEDSDTNESSRRRSPQTTFLYSRRVVYRITRSVLVLPLIFPLLGKLFFVFFFLTETAWNAEWFSVSRICLRLSDVSKNRTELDTFILSIYTTKIHSYFIVCSTSWILEYVTFRSIPKL